MGHSIVQSTAILINVYELEVVKQFTYLGSTTLDNLYLDAENNRQIDIASTTSTIL